MHLKGEERIAATPDTVWAALIDPKVLRRLIPGCERMEGNPATGYDIAAARKVGSTEVRMTGRIDLTDLRPGEGCTLHASGSGGAAGGASGAARIRLIPDGTGTRLAWDLDAATQGALARFPNFVVKMAAQRVADGFVRRFKGAVEGVAPPPKKSILGRLLG